MGSMRGAPKVWGPVRGISTVWGQCVWGDPYTLGSREGGPCHLGSTPPSRGEEPSPHRVSSGGDPGRPPSPRAAPALRAAASALSRRKTESSGRSPLRRCPGSAAESEKETAAAGGPAPGPPPRACAAASPRLTPDVGLQGRHAAADGRGAQRQQAARPLRRHRPAPRRHLGAGAGRAAAILGGEAAGGHFGEVKAGRGSGGTVDPGLTPGRAARGARRSDRSRTAGRGGCEEQRGERRGARCEGHGGCHFGRGSAEAGRGGRRALRGRFRCRGGRW